MPWQALGEVTGEIAIHCQFCPGPYRACFLWNCLVLMNCLPRCVYYDNRQDQGIRQCMLLCVTGALASCGAAGPRTVYQLRMAHHDTSSHRC